jgi:acyl-CoA thioester hydrolase
MTYEIDFAGVVSNIVYVRWLEDLRNLFCDFQHNSRIEFNSSISLEKSI